MALAVTIISLLIALVAVGLLIINGFKLRPTRVTLPFLDLNVSKFEALTIVALFDHVTTIMLKPSAARPPEQLSPLILMHGGWMIVCDAFVKRFSKYPTSDAVNALIKQIGAQNADFLNIFRDLYQASIKEGDRLNMGFAMAYATRAPALAQRILRDQSPLEEFAQNQYALWKMKD